MSCCEAYQSLAFVGATTKKTSQSRENGNDPSYFYFCCQQIVVARGGQDHFFENEAIRGEFSARNGKRYGS
jgi:hypothetical protein